MKSLKARLFVATTADIEVLTKEYLAGVVAAEGSRGTYLTVLIATTQDEVGATPRKERAGKPAKLTQNEIAADRQALRVVHNRFFKAVKKAAADSGLKEPELSKKIKKFCSSASTFMSFIKAGGDLRALVAERETKYSLREATHPSRESKVHQLQRAVTRYVKRTEKLARTAGKENIAETEKVLIDARARIERLLAELLGRPSKRMATTVPQHVVQ